MDDVDRADAEVERYLAEAVSKKKPEGPQPTGRCLWCDEVVADYQRWCGPSCRDQWQKSAG